MKFLIFINIVTFVLVTLKYQHYTDENKISKFLKNRDFYEIILYGRSHRILAKYENQKELLNSRLYYEAQDNGDDHKLMNKRENNNTYEKLKKAKPNNMESYLNSYKYRHSKKRGLNKLDCYYEKKFFSSLDKMEKIAKKKNLSKSRIKKMLYKKYGIPLFIMCLLPLFGLILPIRYYDDIHTSKDTCREYKQGASPNEIKYLNHDNCKFLSRTYIYLNSIFIFSVVFLIVFIIIYTIIKVAKYERIKHGY